MQDKQYRPNVAAVILAPSYPFDCRIFIAQRSDIKSAWQFPQGGIDENESPKQALLRELREEIGTDKVEILCEFPEWIKYDFPEHALKKMFPFIGQTQKYFLLRLLPNAKININTKKPEFDAYKFVDLNELYKIVTPFKKDIYKIVLKYFCDKNYI